MSDRDLADFDEREFQKTNTKLYLGNLPGHYPGNPKQQKDAARLYVENLCQRYGQPTDILVNVEKRFAFVTFQNKEAAQYAIYQLAETNVGGNVLHVSWSKPSKEQLAARDARRARENAEYAKKEGTAKPAEGNKSESKSPAEQGPEAHKPAEGQKSAEGQKPADEKLETKAEKAKTVEPVVVEKPDPVRFASQQKVAVKQPQQPRQPQPAKKSQPQQPKPPQQTKVAPQQPKAPKPVPQKFKVTVQNETTPGLPTVVLSISFEEYTKYICPLISNNNTSKVVKF